MATLYDLPQYKTTTLSVVGGIDNSQTTGIILQNVDGVDITKAGLICLTWSDPIDITVAEFVTYTSINGSNELVGVTRGGEGVSAKSHLLGAVVAFVVSKSHINNLNAAMKKVYSEANDTLLKATGAEINTGTEDAKIVTPKAIADSKVFTPTNLAYFNAPQGFLINGKIVPSVASNNLTVAIKGLDGNDPSATNPVYCRIGDTVRAITSALSVTANAGTNWCNAGSAELATKEIDYFVYLMQTSNGTAIVFSRIPYLGLNTFSNYNGVDEKTGITSDTVAGTYTVENIGRFAATLSAGAGYTWSVPTFTTANLIQRPIYETRWLSATSIITALTGTLTTSAGSWKYRVSGNTVFGKLKASVSNKGTGSGGLTATTPFSMINESEYPTLIGAEVAAAGTAVVAYYYTTTQFRFAFYNNTFSGENGYNNQLTGFWNLT